MIAVNKLKGVLSSLSFEGVVQVPVDNLEVLLQSSEDHATVRMSSPVYKGEDYIPKSVRRCIQGRGPCAGFEPAASLLVAERDFRIDLVYDCPLKDVSEGFFINVLQEFGWQVEEWRHFIEHHGEGDLVYIHSKKN